jgi:hypothetical protein
MPISKDEFESGQVLSALTKSIVTFLKKNPDNAYTSSELMEGINFQADFRDFFRAMISGLAILMSPNILDDLAVKGTIRKNFIDGQYYYIAK